MKWNPETMIMHDVYKPFGSLAQAGLRKIGRSKNHLILTFKDDRTEVVAAGEEIPLDYEIEKGGTFE